MTRNKPMNKGVSPDALRSVIAVVGATGFVGEGLVPALLAKGQPVVILGRGSGTVCGLPVHSINESDSLLANARVVIHLAGIAHRTAEEASYNAVNVELPNRLIRSASRNGVQRFVFVSSTHVHGRWSATPMSPRSSYAPDSLYGQSKMEAEKTLSHFAASESLNLDIVRPPLVYGPRAKANFGLLLKAARRGVPLPLGNAKRSVVSLDNLVDALVALSAASDLPGRVLLPADPQDATVREMYRILCEAYGRRAVPLPAPGWLLRPIFSLAGRSETFDSLFKPATIDRSHWESVGWAPPVELRDGLVGAAVAGTSAFSPDQQRDKAASPS